MRQLTRDLLSQNNRTRYLEEQVYFIMQAVNILHSINGNHIHALTMLKLDYEKKLVIQKGLARVQKLLTQHFIGHFLVHREAKFYYQERVSAVEYSKRYVYVIVMVPVSTMKMGYQLYRINVLPLPATSVQGPNLRYWTQVISVPEYLAVARELSSYLSLTRNMLEICEGTTLKICRKAWVFWEST